MTTMPEGESRLTWVLRVWEPELISLSLFTWFSPPQCLLIHLSSAPNQGYLLLAAYVTSICVSLFN
jgi:hypothetical protein